MNWIENTLGKLFLFVAMMGYSSIFSLIAGEKYYTNKEYILTAKSFSSNGDRVEIVYPGDIVELLYIQENLEAIKKEDEFIGYIKFGDKFGFIPLKFIQKKKPLNIKKIRKRAYIEPKIYYVNSTSLPVYQVPGTDNLPIVSLPKNSELIVTRFTDTDEVLDGIPGRWAFFQKGRFEGWVFSGGLSETRIDTPIEDTNRITPGKTYFVIADDTKIRNEPGTFGTPLATIMSGEKVEVLERKRAVEREDGVTSHWVLIKFENIEGWVFGGSLSEKKPEKPKPLIQKKHFSYPLDFEKSKMTSPFGSRIDPVTGRPGIRHTGVDLYPFSRFGAPIYAAGDGIVLHQSFNSGYGNLTVIQHSGGLVSYYAHQLKFLIKQNEKVKAGDLIGEVGSSGKSTGPHLHFEIRTGLWKEQLDPEKFIPVPNK